MVLDSFVDKAQTAIAQFAELEGYTGDRLCDLRDENPELTFGEQMKIIDREWTGQNPQHQPPLAPACRILNHDELRVLFHVTTGAAALAIVQELRMRRGKDGLFDPAIYFAEGPCITFLKARNGP